MNFKKILAATSMLAVVAMPAHALDITAVVPATLVNLADELDNPAAQLSGGYQFDLNTNAGGFYPEGTNLVVRITLPAGVTIRTAVLAGAVTPNGPGNNSITSNVQGATGAVGASVVEFLITVDNDNLNDINSLRFNLDLDVATCTAAPLGGTIQATVSSNGIGLEEGTITEPGSNLVPNTCGSAVNGVVASDEIASDTVIALPAYTTVFENGANPAGTLGTVNYSIDGTFARDAAGTPVTPGAGGDVDFISMDIVFADDSAITGVSVGGIAAASVGGNVWRLTAASDADRTTLLDGVADPVVVAFDGVTPITTQDVSIAAPIVDFNDNNEDFDPNETGASGPLDKLQRDGAIFGTFDWATDSNGAVNTVLRATGFPSLMSSPDVPYTVTLTNSSTGMNGDWSGVITPADVSNGQVMLKSNSGFGGVVPTGFGKADVKISFETGAPIDVDRLISSANGFVADFGGNANSDLFGASPNTPENDSDNNNGTE